MHTGAWLIWLVSAAVAVAVTRNPLYLTLLFVVYALVYETCERVRSDGAIVQPGRFALIAVLLGALFNGLTTHFGETVLVTLPDGLPLVGGPITGEALIYGATNGLVLSTLFTAFSVMSVTVPVRDLIGYVPRAFHPLAVVSAIAVTFVPSTRRQFQQVREAQAVRGLQVRGVRDWLPLLMPVLIGGLERALQLAETMTARGFAHEGLEQERAPWSEGLLVLGLIALLGSGVLRLLPVEPWVSSLTLGGGVLGVALAIWLAGRGVARTRYHRASWKLRDFSAIGFSLAALGLFLLGSGASRLYSPYPALSWPPFRAGVGIGLLGFLGPLLAGAEGPSSDD
jgi:energy-coupling factor transport system permease protein